MATGMDEGLPELDTDDTPVEGAPRNLMRFPAPIDPYMGMSTLELPDSTQKILLREATPDKVDILPTGEAYMPQIHYRRTLNEAFGPAGGD